METACYYKFSQNDDLKAALLETGDSEIVEAAPRDFRWGIGYGKARALTLPRAKWGRNWLGLVLMRVRATIRSELDGDEEAVETNTDEGAED
mmetsp:Transcript_6865/g.18649  ORF Transcript_6865/g.18649 Transcript_6865/m.18649 type:complete len:92 (-) Transcript_6865:552-827(-)